MTQTIRQPDMQTVRVVAAVIADGDCLLICKRPLDKRHGGLWEFPGGKCEPGESDLATLRRELAEELGVTVSWCGEAELEIRDHGSHFLIAFVPVRISSEPTCLEHLALKWASLEELLRVDLAPSDRQYVEHALRTRGRCPS